MQCCSVQSLKYLGAQFVAAKKLKCSVDNVRLKFYRTFNAIYSRSKGAQSLQLFKSYCLSFTLYATEVMPLSKHSLKTLDFCERMVLAADRRSRGKRPGNARNRSAIYRNSKKIC